MRHDCPNGLPPRDHKAGYRPGSRSLTASLRLLKRAMDVGCEFKRHENQDAINTMTRWARKQTRRMAS